MKSTLARLFGVIDISVIVMNFTNQALSGF